MPANCVNCGTPIRWMDTFPGDICVNCHKVKMAGQDAQAAYKEMMGTFSQTAVPTNFKKKKKGK